MTAPSGLGAGDTKTAWRRWARSLPASSPVVVEAVNANLERFLEGVDGVVLGYVALADEIDVTAALSALAPGRLALPRLGDDALMTTHIDDGEREYHRIGIAQPRSDAPIIQVDALAAVVVPGRVFDRRGYRLGRGGGHYDRLVPLLGADTPVIGVVDGGRVVDELPAEAHDCPMTHLMTEAGVAMVDA